MAVYKVPQDVEAEDKLLGPFSFRQFIYLIIVAMSIAAAWGLGMIFVGLAVIPLPIILVFGALALPLRKDQPMETYLAAMIQFFIKPHRRLWMADGIVSNITIDAPKQVDQIRLKDFGSSDANSQFDYLAQVADTRGWSTRGVTDPTGSISNTSFDILDDSSLITQSFNGMLEQQDAQRKDDILQRMAHGAPASNSVSTDPQLPMPPTFNYSAPTVATSSPASVSPQVSIPTSTTPAEEPKLEYNPYPVAIQQRVVNPISESLQNTPIEVPMMSSEPSMPAPSPAIIMLAQDDSGLSIETIAKEAHRIEELKASGEEVVISLH